MNRTFGKRFTSRNESLETSSGTQTIQGWPVHEPGWKREILRTEVELALVG